MKSSLKFLSWVALMVLITIGIFLIVAAAVPALIYRWWREEKQLYEQQQEHLKFDEVYPACRAPWNRRRHAR